MTKRLPSRPIDEEESSESEDDELLADYPNGDSSTDEEEVLEEPREKFVVTPANELKIEYFAKSTSRKILCVNGSARIVNPLDDIYVLGQFRSHLPQAAKRNTCCRRKKRQGDSL